ncbi:hypothetical protein BH20ACT23_BH20ACT23_03480 [soil metagenome]
MSTHRFACHAMAKPLRTLLDRSGPSAGTVLGSSQTAVYLAFGDGVVALTARAVPLMPNGATIIEGDGLDAFGAGAVVRIAAGGLRAGRVEVTWDRAPLVDLAVSRNMGYDARDVARRGHELLGAMRLDADPIIAITEARPELVAGDGLDAVGVLLAALRDEQPEAAAQAARMLTGRGPGLTPDGDDLLAAAVAAMTAFEGPTGMSPEAASALRAALLVDDLGERTGALPASLLRLAAEGQVIDPVRSLLDLAAERPAWERALARLQRIGHGTGGTYALGCALAALALAGSFKTETDRHSR